MTIDDIRVLKRARPFRPFNIVLNDGRVVWVPGSELIALSPTGKTVAVFEGNAASFLVVERITALQPDAEPPGLARLKQRKTD